MRKLLGAVTAVAMLLACIAGVRGDADRAKDKVAIEQMVRDSIGWALTKDRALAERVIAHDPDLFVFNPDSTSTSGWEAFVKNFEFWMDPRFKATSFDVRDLVVTLSRSGDVAWYSAVLDDLALWDGRPTGWKDTRWTGVVEKRGGRWVIVQMHFSFASDKPRDGRYQEPERLPSQVNSGTSQFNAFVAPDESYLVVPVIGRTDSLGGCDYYVVFRATDDRWSEPINLGPTINTPGSQEFSPYVSPDGKYFFFMSSRFTRPDRLTYALLRDLRGRPGNGNADTWWVDATLVTSLRARAVFAPSSRRPGGFAQGPRDHRSLP
jgi:ketosteroid isomerase-like protein